MSSTAVLPRAHARGRSEQRTLATHTILALLIAVAGLLAASSLSLTSRADATAARPAQPAAVDPQTVARRSATLQAALLAEVAAQCGDALARSAQAVARASITEAGTARQQQLSAAQATLSAAAAAIAQERLEAAAAARQAAVDARQAAVDAGLATGATPDADVDPTLSGQALTPVTGTSGSLPVGTRGVLPVASGVVGSKFGATGSWATYHTGLDFRAAYGTQIHSVLAGVVVYAGSSDSSSGWAGNHVAVRHVDGRTTMYSHMSRVAVATGQTVQTGQVLGYVGQTGRAFGAHLHFELYPQGVRYGDVYHAVDPMPYLRDIGVRTR